VHFAAEPNAATFTHELGCRGNSHPYLNDFSDYFYARKKISHDLGAEEILGRRDLKNVLMG